MAEAKLKYNKNWYVPEYSRLSNNLSDAEIKTEYSRLRSIARKRLERMEGTEWAETEIYQYNKNRFVPLKEIKSNSELAHKLSEVSRFIEADRSSISGLQEYRSKNIKTLHEHGYTFVNKKNFNDFTRFMEEMRIKHMKKSYDSERVAEVYGTATKKKVDPNKLKSDFDYWYKNLEKLEQWEPAPNENPFSSDNLKKAIRSKDNVRKASNRRKSK